MSVDDWVGPPEETPDGWVLPLEGKLVGRFYIAQDDVAFEVWLGGESDLMVRLEDRFTYGPRAGPESMDPTTTRKTDLGPLLAIADLAVATFEVRESGHLAVTFSDDSGLVAGPSSNRRAWILEWPWAGKSGAALAAREGRGVEVVDWDEGEMRVSEDVSKGQEWDARSLEPVVRDSIMDLPIRGPVTECSISGSSVEFTVPMGDAENFFGIHIGGVVELSETGRVTWHGDAAAPDRTSLSGVLDVVGQEVVAAQQDGAKRLLLGFGDGRTLSVKAGAWEAHWPKAPGVYDDHWVPEPGPRIP